jgi:hypothetical protein
VAAHLGLEPLDALHATLLASDAPATRSINSSPTAAAAFAEAHLGL